MRFLLKNSYVLFLFLFACSKEELVPQQTCQFTGKTTVYDFGSGYQQKSVSNTELDADDPKMPKSVMRSYVTESKDLSANKLLSKTAETYTYTFQYDAQGFLKTLTAHRVYLFEGSDQNSFLEGNQSYRNYKLDNIQTTEFAYQSEKVLSAVTKVVNTVKGDNNAAVISESEHKKVYEYNGNGQVVSALTTMPGGQVPCLLL